MRIDTSGNYNPFMMRNVQPKAQTPQTQNTNSASEPVSISKEEKDFFAKMFPDNSSEISNYHFYRKNGSLSGVALGQNFDRRG